MPVNVNLPKDYWERLAAMYSNPQDGGGQAPPGNPAPQDPRVTYTPDGIARQPGYFNPTNPYDTGRPNESNRERNGGAGGSLNGWDYDNGRPMPGAVLGEDGLYVLGGGSGGGGGGAATINNPYYQQLQSLLTAQGSAEAANFRNMIQQALIGYGLIPEKFNDKFGALDALTKSLIAKNTESGISTYARLLEDKRHGVKDLMNRLNARGLRRSGARGFGLRKNQLTADRALADSLQGLMQYINNAYGTYTGNEYQRQMQLLQAAMQYASGSSGSTVAPGGGGSSSFSPYVYNSQQAAGFNQGAASGAFDWFAPLANTNPIGGSGGGTFRAM